MTKSGKHVLAQFNDLGCEWLLVV